MEPQVLSSFSSSFSPGPQLCMMQLGGVSSPQLTQARHSHMLRGLSPSMTLDPVALTGATVILRRGLAEVFCSRSPAKTGTPFHVNVQQIAGQEEHSSYAQHVGRDC